MGLVANMGLFALGFLFIWFAVWNISIYLAIGMGLLIAIVFFANMKMGVYPIVGMIVAGVIQIYMFFASIHIPFIN